MADIYRSLQDKSAVNLIQGWIDGFGFQPGPDGLEVIPPPKDAPSQVMSPDMSVRLHDRLIDIRLLRHIPLCYLLPDAALLPSESIRFFHVNQTWVDRVIDGVISAADIGTLDLTYTAGMLYTIRRDLDQALEAMAQALVPDSDWTADKPMTGFLMRSEAARRWPDMGVSAYKNIEGSSQADTKQPVVPIPIPVLRHASISDSIYIALFAGEPKCVELRESHVALRFGVEGKPGSPGKYETHQRDPDGKFTQTKATPQNPAVDVTPLDIAFRSGRVLNITDLAQKINDPQHTGKPQNTTAEPRMVALDLERLAYVQMFSTPESNGEDSGWLPSVPINIQILKPGFKPGLLPVIAPKANP
jgi:hypothetical protein